MRSHSEVRNRVIAAAVVGLGHVVVVMLISVSRLPTEGRKMVLDDGTIYFFPTSTSERRSSKRTGGPTLRPPRLEMPMIDVPDLLRSALSTVVALPPLPEPSAPAGVGWQQDITDVASDLIERARAAGGRTMGRPQRSPSFSPLHEKPHTFEWLRQHSHEVIDEHGVPQWVLVQPCQSELLVQKPDCTVERVLRHGVLFEYMTEQHEATLQYGGPNAVP